MSEEKDREAVRSMVLSELLIQEEQKHKAAKLVLHEEYDSDMKEILSQIRNLQERVNALEKKLESQE